MLTPQLEKELVNWTAQNSGHEFRRRYIGLSGIGDCERLIYERVRNGNYCDLSQHLKTRLSYELESDLAERIKTMGLFGPGETISLFDGLVQGHTDGLIEGREVLEIKTVGRAAHLPNQKLPSRVYWQVQAYMHYLRRPYTHVIYLARESGEIRAIGIRYHESTGRRIEEKIGRLVDAVLTYSAPACTCGRCAASSDAGPGK